MSPFGLIGGALKTGLGIGRLFVGGWQKRRGMELARNLVRPKVASTGAAGRRIGIASKYMSNVPTSEIDKSQNLATYANAVYTSKTGGTNIGNISSDILSTGVETKAAQIGIKDSKSMMEGYRSTGQALRGFQLARDRQYKNLMELYKMDASAASAMMGAGMENIFGGGQELADSFTNMGEIQFRREQRRGYIGPEAISTYGMPTTDYQPAGYKPSPAPIGGG